MTSPNGAVPDKAYVSGGSGQSGLSDLNDLTEGVAKSRMRAPLANSFGNQVNGFWGAVSGLVGAVVGGVTAVVNGIVGVINSIAGLFTTTRVDMGKVDKARADAENAIVENMSSSLEMLDEIQRFGGAYCSSPQWSATWGENTPDVLPLTDAFPLAAGTLFIPPVDSVPPSGTYADTEANKQLMARKAGRLVLNESGLWLIFFQVGVLQGSERITQPADVWAYVTPAAQPHTPIGTPGMSYAGVNPLNSTFCVTRSLTTGVASGQEMLQDYIAAYGRASSYVGLNNSRNGGGVTVFGCFPVYLQTANWKITLSVQSWAKFGGASTSNVIAYKVNSESIRDSIDDLKDQIELALPGASTQLDLDEASIQAMVTEAQNVEVDIDYNGD